MTTVRKIKTKIITKKMKMSHDYFCLYDDELLYSAIGRHLELNGEISLRDGIFDTFGDVCSIPTFKFPCSLDKFVNRFPKEGILTSDYLIKNHTLFPVYSSFMPAARRLEIINQMKFFSGHGVQHRIGVTAGGLLRKKDLYFCPGCAAEEFEKYGQAFFHRLHQIEGVIICEKHMRRLHIYEKETMVSRLEYKTLGEEQIVSTMEPNNDIKYPEMMVWINKQFKSLLSGVLEADKDLVHSLYVSKLQENDLALPSGSVRQIDLHDLFIQRYSQEFLSHLESYIDYFNEYNWLKVITRNSKRTSHPLRHVLLIGFLFGNIDNLIEYSRKYNQKHEKYPCLNPACKYYLKDVLDECIISYDYKAKKTVGTFSCSCGFIYSRYLNNSDKYKFGRIKEFGEVWEMKLFNEVNSGYNISQVAKILKCDKKTVIRQALKLGLGDRINSKYKTIKDYDYKYNNTQSRKPIQVDSSHTIEAKEPCRNATKARKRVDWAQRDDTIVDEMILVLPMLYKGDRKYRVSKTLMCSAIGKSSLIAKNLEKLPKTKAFMDKHYENVVDFQCFRIDRVSKAMVNEGEELTKWRIVRRAGLGNDVSKKANDQIEKWL